MYYVYGKMIRLLNYIISHLIHILKLLFMNFLQWLYFDYIILHNMQKIIINGIYEYEKEVNEIL